MWCYAEIYDLDSGEVVAALGIFETLMQARTACINDARQTLMWESAPSGYWIALSEERAYRVWSEPL